MTAAVWVVNRHHHNHCAGLVRVLGVRIAFGGLVSCALLCSSSSVSLALAMGLPSKRHTVLYLHAVKPLMGLRTAWRSQTGI